MIKIKTKNTTLLQEAPKLKMVIDPFYNCAFSDKFEDVKVFLTFENVHVENHQPQSPDLISCDFFFISKAGGHLYGKLLFTWLSLVMSMMVSFCAVLFPTRCLG